MNAANTIINPIAAFLLPKTIMYNAMNENIARNMMSFGFKD